MHLSQPDIEAIANLVVEKIAQQATAPVCPGRWLTLKEAMAYAKVKSRDTIMKWIDEGFIYAFKRSGEWVVDRESIDDWFLSERG